MQPEWQGVVSVVAFSYGSLMGLDYKHVLQSNDGCGARTSKELAGAALLILLYIYMEYQPGLAVILNL